jgi:alpha-beta hydrolase superfamily lysophospholipase
MIRLEFAAIPRMLAKAPADITKLDWDIDDHIHKDMPAIIDFVSRESGFGKVYCIGHSMGSIIIFGYLEMENTSRVAGFISLSSMVVIPRPLDPRLEAAACEKQLLTAALLLNATIAAQLRNYTHGTIKSPIEELLMNKGNMEKAVVSSFFRAAVDDTSPGIMDQFAASLRAGRMLSADGKFDYTGAMHLVKTPILVAGGSADSIVAERGLKSTYEAVSSPDKSIVVFSKAGGYSTDYGHCDLILGRNSAEEVYPVLLRWLDERAARADSMTAEFQTLGGRKTGSSP